MVKGFMLKEVYINNHSIFNDFKTNFTYEDIKDIKYPLTTLLIGPNGFGKSFFLRIIVDIFRELYAIKHKEKRISSLNFDYDISYEIDGVFYFALKSKRKREWFKKDFHIVEKIKIEDLMLPNKITAVSSILTDRFPFSKNEVNNYYDYLGIKTTAISTSTKALPRKVVDILIKNIDKGGLLKNISKLLGFLYYDEFLGIKYSIRRTKVFGMEINSVDELDNIFNSFKEKRKTMPMGNIKYEGLDYIRKKEMLKFIQEKAWEYNANGNQKEIVYQLSFNDVNDNFKLQNDYPLLELLRATDLLSAPSIEVKNKEQFDLFNASSGELNILFNFLGMLSSIQPNSLVLIDEPEVSLHPNWLMKYIHLLKDIFKEYSSSYFLISTHSHFLVSDLDNETSKVISLNKDSKGNFTSEQFSNTYGKSAEDILYEIFNVPTTRNYYLAVEFAKVSKELEKTNPNIEKIRDNLLNLKNISQNMKEEDPLKSLIIKIVTKYKI